MMLMICADVLLRNVRIVPGLLGVAWANEVSEYALYLITMLTAPWLLRQGQHIRVDIAAARDAAARSPGIASGPSTRSRSSAA